MLVPQRVTDRLHVFATTECRLTRYFLHFDVIGNSPNIRCRVRFRFLIEMSGGQIWLTKNHDPGFTFTGDDDGDIESWNFWTEDVIVFIGQVLFDTLEDPAVKARLV